MVKSKNRDHLNLLCDIGELATLIIGSTDIQGFLQQTVEMVARHLNADVGSIYLYDDTTFDLVLQATVGLNPSAVGRVRMKSGEGLVGKTFESLRPICEDPVPVAIPISNTLKRPRKIFLNRFSRFQFTGEMKKSVFWWYSMNIPVILMRST